MDQIAIFLLCLSCTRSITLFKKQIALQNWCFTSTVHSFILKLQSSLAHIIPLDLLTHTFIALLQSHYNKTLSYSWERCKEEHKEHCFFQFTILLVPNLSKKILRKNKISQFLFKSQKGALHVCLFMLKNEEGWHGVSCISALVLSARLSFKLLFLFLHHKSPAKFLDKKASY